MSEHNEHQQRDYSNFDTMPTGTLEEILRLDAQLPEGETPDPDAILYIMEVLAGRKRENSSIPDIETAWRTFNESYRPCTEDATSLYEEEETIDKTDSSKKSEDIQMVPPMSAPRHSRRPRQLRFRMGFAAMLAVAVLITGTVTASAFGYDIWSVLAKWTGEVFGFQTAVAEEKLSATRQLSPLRHVMKDYGVDEKVLPSYLPEDYEVVNTKCQVEEEFIRFDCFLSDGEGNIILSYYVFSTDDFSYDYEKNLENPELYEAGGVGHYIVTNIDTYSIIWTSGNVECNILGITSVEEAKRIVDSIYEE